MSLTWYCWGNRSERFRWQHGGVLTCFCKPVKAGEAATRLWGAVANFFLPTDGMVLVNWRSKRWQRGFLQNRGKWSSSCFVSMSQALHLTRVDFYPARERGKSLATPVVEGSFWQFTRNQFIRNIPIIWSIVLLANEASLTALSLPDIYLTIFQKPGVGQEWGNPTSENHMEIFVGG